MEDRKEVKNHLHEFQPNVDSRGPKYTVFPGTFSGHNESKEKKKKTAGVARKFSRIYWPELGWEEMFLQAVCYRAGREGTHWRTGD